MNGLNDYIIGLRHVGHVVEDMEAAIHSFTRLYGLDKSMVQRIPGPGDGAEALFAFLTVGDTQFELIQPVSSEQLSVLGTAPSGGGGINHVAWTIRAMDEALASLVPAS